MKVEPPCSIGHASKGRMLIMQRVVRAPVFWIAVAAVAAVVIVVLMVGGGGGGGGGVGY